MGMNLPSVTNTTSGTPSAFSTVVMNTQATSPD